MMTLNLLKTTVTLPRKLFLLTCLLSSLAFAGDWSLKDKDGVRHTQSGEQGHWVLVNFWAPWCPSCLQEMPDLTSLQKQHKDLQVIGVVVMYKNRREVMDMAKDISYPIVLGNEDTAADFGGMTGLPTSFLYAPNGKLIGKHEGPLTKEEVEQAIKGKSAATFTR